MPVVDWDQVPDSEDFTPAPEGWYPCECSSAEKDYTKDGKEHFVLHWRVLEGAHRGKKIRDKLFFHSEGGLKRVKVVCKKLGLRTSGQMALEPESFRGLRALVESGIESWQGDDGREFSRNVVTFGGYDEINSEQAASAASGNAGGSSGPDDELPF